jgi:hypothetical protein
MINAPLRSATCRIAALRSALPLDATQLNAPTFPPLLRRDGRKTIQSRLATRRNSPRRTAAQLNATTKRK